MRFRQLSPHIATMLGISLPSLLLTIQLFPFAVFRIYNNNNNSSKTLLGRVSAPMCWLLVVQITVEVDILGASTVSCLRIKWSFDLSDTVAFTLALPLCAAYCSLVIEGPSRHTTFFILHSFIFILMSSNCCECFRG